MLSDSGRIVFKLTKNKFSMYDFEKIFEINNFVVSTNLEKKIIKIVFDNEASFLLTLKLQDACTKEKLLLELVTRFENPDKI